MPRSPSRRGSTSSACWCRRGGDGLRVGAIADRLGLPAATLSFHLNQLRQAGLITFRRAGRSLIYSSEFAAMNALLGYLTENCCQGDPSACGVVPGPARVPLDAEARRRAAAKAVA